MAYTEEILHTERVDLPEEEEVEEDVLSGEEKDAPDVEEEEEVE